jgi:hypothetical protein
MWTQLTKREITTEHGESGLTKRIGEGDEERRLAIRAGSVGKDKGIARGTCGKVKKAANRGRSGGIDKLIHP